jgi:predicted ABC-type ATPase
METTLYVIAGPNGIGKTSSTYNLVPASTPVINSDEIARQVKLSGIADNINTQEYSNREATK